MASHWRASERPSAERTGGATTDDAREIFVKANEGLMNDDD